MRRRNREHNDSLGLLLDTICNTFGGIIFLALLVCILSRNVGQGTQLRRDVESTSLQYAEVASQVRKLSAEDEHMSELVSHQRQLLKSMGASDADLKHISELLGEIHELENQIARFDSAIAEEQKKQSVLKNEYHQISEQLLVLRAELTRKKAEIAQRQQRQEIKVRLPISRLTSKMEVPVLLLGGKVYEPFEYESDGFSRTVKSSYYKALLDNELTVDEIKKQIGLVVNTRDQIVHWRKKLTKPLSPDSHYIGLAVWPDSYNEFIRIRNDLVEQGYEYRLLILDQGEPLVFDRRVHGVVQ
jgi:hypothetical protein